MQQIRDERGMRKQIERPLRGKGEPGVVKEKNPVRNPVRNPVKNPVKRQKLREEDVNVYIPHI